MKKLLLLLILSTTSFVSAQITELTYSTVSNTLNVDQVSYELFGEPDLLWGDVVRRHSVDAGVITNPTFAEQSPVQNGRTFTVSVIMNGLQPEQYFVHYAIDGQYAPDQITTIELPELTAEFTVPSAGVYQIWYSSRTFIGGYSQTGAEEFTVE